MNLSSKRVAVLHYASPPTVGGVESIIAYHARGLSTLGYQVRVISGSGAAFDPPVESRINPRFGSRDPEILRVKRELDRGIIPDGFASLVQRLADDLTDALAGCRVCVVHNVLTLNKNLALTAALARLNAANTIPLVGWCHDLAWTNEQYLPELHPGEPWDLLRHAWPGVRYVVDSEVRQHELAGLLKLAGDDIQVIPPGVDPGRFFHWTDTTRDLDDRLRLLDADGLLLVPARLTRRKNIEVGLHILAHLRQQSGRDIRLIVTGPPGPHNPANAAYLDELRSLRRTLGLDTAAHIVYDCGTGGAPLLLDDDTMSNLYALADALLFPSTQEGFGIPILEAGLVGLPIFCADIPPLRATGQQDVTYFDPRNDPPSQIASRILTALEANPAARLRIRVRQHFRWEALIRDNLVPLLEGS
ncbi:MAG TPA: glycosyltransferase family 4 protein [Aggregatilineales bacterium]|nr:glycosyltransferase family 4 protein [Aggregatilineales bacterium]